MHSRPDYILYDWAL